MKHRISLIAVITAKERALGKDGTLLFQMPEDLARFKTLTKGHPVIMGRKTWESLPRKPLPGRMNVVVTRNGSYRAEGATCVTSLDAAFDAARTALGNDEIFVIGGGELYAKALPFAHRLYLTLVESSAKGDTFFPAHPEFTRIVKTESGTDNGHPYVFEVLERQEFERAAA